MTSGQPNRIKTITDYHRMLGLPNPEHPLISVINLESFQRPVTDEPVSLIFDFYSISLKKNFHLRMKYGQQSHDFDEGVFFCMAPGQVITIELNSDALHRPSGWMILVHPDFLWNTALAKTIKKYEFFGYSVNEALYLSDREEGMITGIVQYMEQEYNTNIDKFSQPVIIAQLELLLTYADRFYQRQFITRQISNHKILDKLETLLTGYFNSDDLLNNGLPTVHYVAETLNVSPSYLSGLLKALTGQSTQQHIHNKLIDKAKELLSTTDLSVSEIAYALGFEHLQSFSKLFKAKVNRSPLEFRQSFN
ncbi:helix-turn-helix domain-containing protein [Spirosoma pollinicola]|uniref:AraC family transcriptional regulator n=1 Tax=Spirosoma pollinicola TaxID=2057025 RepID=A0A2K8Z7H3_9BACT|nr:helix-turn-helix transcriptional regulator [Spirosoma pollinicola]AUD05825.1 AraC family transcriptional regulator [Spirosoma pollinicola]